MIARTFAILFSVVAILVGLANTELPGTVTTRS